MNSFGEPARIATAEDTLLHKLYWNGSTPSERRWVAPSLDQSDQITYFPSGMSNRYSTYDAKAKFSEILRKVRTGQHVIVSSRGEAVAEIRPVYEAGGTEKVLRDFEERGVLSRATAPTGKLKPLARKPGSLKRFLKSRE